MGPINDSVYYIFGWDDGTIALFANWGPICYIISVIPLSWVLDELGLRWSCLIGTGLCFAGAGVRCFTTEREAATGLAHLGQIFNGFAGPLAMSAGPLLSATWFPPNQRTTATAIQATSNYFGWYDW